jgi:Multiubiquitin/Integrase core domain
MSTTADAALSRGDNRHTIEVADDTLTFRSVAITDLTPTGTQLAKAAGFKPPDTAIVLQMLADGALETIRPDEVVDLRHDDGRFIIVESDRLYLFSVNGERFDWPARVATGAVVRNRKKTQRLCREEGLAVRRRIGRKRAVGSRAPAPVAALPNQRWSLESVHDQMASGRRFRVLNVGDDVTRECLAAVPDTSISGRRVVRKLTELISRRGKPGMIVSDNGTELTSNAVLEWCGDARIE